MLIDIPDDIPLMHIITFAVQNGCVIGPMRNADGAITLKRATPDQSAALRLAIAHVNNKQRATDHDNAA